MKARPYEGINDLHAMFGLLSEGRKSNNGTFYVHRGDLQWWLFYTDTPQDVWQSNIRLWIEGDRLIGWTLLSPDESAFDVYTVPELRGDPRESEMFARAMDELSTLDGIRVFWIAESDDVRRRWFEGNGFTLSEKHTARFTRSLSGPLNYPALPDGFHIRASGGTEEDARLRAVASHAAFGSEVPFAEYWLRTWRLMQSPIYVPEHEIFVIAPNGQVAAYCIVWTDELNKVGHFEPVGTHPDFQRKGLGKCLLFDALRRLKSEGMNEADVCTNHDNEAAVPLYKSVGFQVAEKLLIYQKKRSL